MTIRSIKFNEGLPLGKAHLGPEAMVGIIRTFGESSQTLSPGKHNVTPISFWNDELVWTVDVYKDGTGKVDLHSFSDGGIEINDAKNDTSEYAASDSFCLPEQHKLVALSKETRGSQIMIYGIIYHKESIDAMSKKVA